MERHTNNNFSQGFVMGAILGAGAVFFFGTEKGKKLLTVLSEEGLQGLDDVAKLIDNHLEKGEQLEDSSKVVSDSEEKGITTVASTARRFFKRKAKK